MLFGQFRFLIFFGIVFAVHWLLRGNSARKWWLLLASHFFYACLFLGGPESASAEAFAPVLFYEKLAAGQALPIGWWFPIVLWGSTLMDYLVGLGIGRSQEPCRRKAWLSASLVVNLGVLAFFKYYNFGVESVYQALSWLGLPASKWTLSIFLPYGISFYTFQSMSYSIDVYRRRLEPMRSFLDLAFFIAYFPPLVAGPIVRAITFLPQVFVRREWVAVDVRACLVLFLVGWVKKACISENVAATADAFFLSPGRYDTLSGLIGVTLYAVQIYCDFSGYTDMAIACSRLLGYELTPNFNFPYFSRNITEFWRRWHISLSTWLRDYLYISLGGNRGTKVFTYRNLMLTMLLGGLWHGASWTFVIWGGLHGLALIVHREWQRLTESWGAAFHKGMAWAAAPLTFFWILITWVFFRAQPLLDGKQQVKASSFQVAGEALGVITGVDVGRKTQFSRHWVWILLILAAVHYVNSRGWVAEWWRRLPDWAFYGMLGSATAVAIFFVQAKFTPFIYFQF